MLEIGASGSVGGEGGNILVYPAAIAARLDRSDTMRSPGALPPCDVYRVAVEVEARRRGNLFQRHGVHAGTERGPYHNATAGYRAC